MKIYVNVIAWSSSPSTEDAKPFRCAFNIIEGSINIRPNGIWYGFGWHYRAFVLASSNHIWTCCASPLHGDRCWPVSGRVYITFVTLGSRCGHWMEHWLLHKGQHCNKGISSDNNTRDVRLRSHTRIIFRPAANIMQHDDSLLICQIRLNGIATSTLMYRFHCAISSTCCSLYHFFLTRNEGYHFFFMPFHILPIFYLLTQ